MTFSTDKTRMIGLPHAEESNDKNFYHVQSYIRIRLSKNQLSGDTITRRPMLVQLQIAFIALRNNYACLIKSRRVFNVLKVLNSVRSDAQKNEINITKYDPIGPTSTRPVDGFEPWQTVHSMSIQCHDWFKNYQGVCYTWLHCPLTSDRETSISGQFPTSSASVELEPMRCRSDNCVRKLL